MIVRRPVKCEKMPAYWRKLLVERNEEIVVSDCGGGHLCPPPPDLPDAPVVDPDRLIGSLDVRYR